MPERFRKEPDELLPQVKADIQDALESAWEKGALPEPSTGRRTTSNKIHGVLFEDTHLTWKKTAQIAGITLIAAAGGAVLTEAVGVVFLGAAISQVIPWMGVGGVITGALGFHEARKGTA